MGLGANLIRLVFMSARRVLKNLESGVNKQDSLWTLKRTPMNERRAFGIAQNERHTVMDDALRTAAVSTQYETVITKS